MTTFQASNVVLSFFKDSFLPYKCFSDLTVEVKTESHNVSTIGDGHWSKVRYKGLSWTVSLSGSLILDTPNFTGFDIFQNQLGFSNVTFQCSWVDSAGVIKSVQGEALVDTSSFQMSPGNLVKDNISLIGSGELKFFDGTDPCPTSIDSISVGGNTASDGNVTVTYTYTGPVFQIKWRLNSSGPYSYVSIGTSISIPSMDVGDYSIELIPVCSNNYEGISDSTTFSVTRALTCTLGITSITPTVTGSTVVLSILFNASPATATYKYRINNGSGYGGYIVVGGPLSNPQPLNLSLPIGSYTIEITPICANGVSGTPSTQGFTVSSSSTISTINYSFTTIPGGSPGFRIYVNGSLMVNLIATGSGSITAPSGATILSQVFVTQSGRDMSLNVTDTTTSTTLYNHSQITGSGTITDSHSNVANGDTYSITGVISP